MVMYKIIIYLYTLIKILLEIFSWFCESEINVSNILLVTDFNLNNSFAAENTWKYYFHEFVLILFMSLLCLLNFVNIFLLNYVYRIMFIEFVSVNYHIKWTMISLSKINAIGFDCKLVNDPIAYWYLSEIANNFYLR